MKKALLSLMLVVLTSLAALADIPINSTYFPDAEFRSRLQQQFGSSLSQSEINNCTQLNLGSPASDGYDDIYSLEGIQYFTALTHLDCILNSISLSRLR